MRKLTIEKLLTWAFAQELPKVGATADGSGTGYSMAWSGMAEMAVLGTIIDRSPNAFGVMPSFVYEGAPHPDAVIVGDAVRALAGLGGFEIDDRWNPMDEFNDPAGIIAAEVARIADEQRARGDRLAGKHIVNLVISSALIGRGPDWSAAEPKVAMVTRSGMPTWFIQRKAKGRDGKAYTFEDSGYDYRKRRPMKGAYRKWRLAAPIRSDVLSRLDWQLWQSALEHLQESLAGKLQSVQIVEFMPDRHPWKRVKKAAINSASA